MTALWLRTHFRVVAQAGPTQWLQLRGIKLDGWHDPRQRKDHQLDERTVLTVRGGAGRLQFSSPVLQHVTLTLGTRVQVSSHACVRHAGGAGCTSTFRPEPAKLIADGGNGGNGGDVILQACSRCATACLRS